MEFEEIIKMQSSIELKNNFMEWLLSKPLYRPYKITKDGIYRLNKLYDNSDFCSSCYCSMCDKESTIRIDSVQALNKPVYALDIDNFGDLFTVNAKCTLDKNHTYTFTLKYDEVKDHIIKIGQLPSFTDILDSGTLSKYESILGRNKLLEVKKASGLASHNTNIGAFVYLRRVFEFLILDAEKGYADSGESLADNYHLERVVNKIEILKDFLPSFISENKIIYGILSKGVHELSEEECREYFDTIYKSIILILEQKLELKNKAKLEKSLSSAINKIHSQIKNTKK